MRGFRSRVVRGTETIESLRDSEGFGEGRLPPTSLGVVEDPRMDDGWPSEAKPAVDFGKNEAMGNRGLSLIFSGSSGAGFLRAWHSFHEYQAVGRDLSGHEIFGDYPTRRLPPPDRPSPVGGRKRCSKGRKAAGCGNSVGSAHSNQSGVLAVHDSRHLFSAFR